MRRFVAIALALSLPTTIAAAQALDAAKYPDWRGEWVRIGAGGQYDPTKPPVRGQQPPLTPEYQAIWEARLAEGEGEQYYNPQTRCLPAGMPRMMMAYEPMEVIITPEATYIPITLNNEFRRIYTDGRDCPTAKSRPTRATRSAGGSMRTETAATTCSRSRPAT